MHRLDDLDIRIFRELGSPASLQWNVRETYSSIARRVGVDEETVRRRIKKAEKLGSVTGWRMMVNPHVIGCEAASIDIEVKDEGKKEKALGEIRRIDGVTKILDFRGKGLQVTMYHPSEAALTRRTELVKSICDSSEEPVVWKMDFPSSNFRFTSTDLRIVQALLEDARTGLETVSMSIGVSVRTISRRLSSLAEGRAVFLQGTPNFRAFAGLSCVFLVFCTDVAKKRMVDGLVLSSPKAQKIEIFNTDSKQHSTYVTVLDNLFEADEFGRFIQSLDGVNFVKVRIMKALIVEQNWLRDEISQRL